MYCSNCGCELHKNVKFCSECGKEVSNYTDNNKNSNIKKKTKNKNALKYVMGLISFILLLIVSIFFINYSRNQHNQKKQEEIAIQNMQQTLDDYSIALDEYIIDEAGTERYKQLLKSLEHSITNKDIEEGTALITNIVDYISEIDLASRSVIKNKIEMLESTNANGALDAEHELIRNYATRVERLLSEEKYRSALGITDEWEKLCDMIQAIGDYQILVSQIDASSYPKIKLYLQINNLVNGESVKINQYDGFSLMQYVKDTYEQKELLTATQLNMAEKMNINLVADISGSMNEHFDSVKSVMQNFINNIQFSSGDQAALITFDSNISIDSEFTTDSYALANAVDAMQVGNMTALYDALYVAISKTAMQDGAKCVIAFTDGYDNDSIRSPEEVIKLAQTYKIPVFIIGIGYDVDSSILSNIADTTGGYFERIDDSVTMQNIYNKIYRQQKELYMLEFEADQSFTEEDMEKLYLSYYNGSMAMHTEATFTPSVLNEKPKDYQELVNRAAIANDEIEDEILRIRGIWTADKEEINKNNYKTSVVSDGIKVYSKDGDIKIIEILKHKDGVPYSRTYNFSNKKLIFAYIEAEDAHRLYFKNDILFRWRYTKDANQKDKAVNHDNEGDSDAFKQWQTFALDEAYRIYVNAEMVLR